MGVEIFFHIRSAGYQIRVKWAKGEIFEKCSKILQNISKELISILNIWAKFLYSPLLEDKVRKMQETNSSVYGAEAASKVHKELKKIGGVKPPREFVFMDRAAIGMGSVFLHLDAEVNWYREFHNLIAGFSQSEIELKQKNLMSIAKIRKDL